MLLNNCVEMSMTKLEYLEYVCDLDICDLDDLNILVAFHMNPIF